MFCSQGNPLTSSVFSRDRKPPITSVLPDRTLNSVDARRVRNAGPPATLSEESTELASTSIKDRMTPLRSMRGVMLSYTPYGLNSVVGLPRASVDT
ncbi:hypothetical protein G6F50_017527 [Rhizopus delemar]|uniref:Uncharacterized protein n=1 Tax=Rhizopus delemar TaxID=936053 RepID=A0A9P6XPQ1_9FUNG|nr:hypothetical protein G6F50_017527 [Rhizopus delemar]